MVRRLRWRGTVTGVFSEAAHYEWALGCPWHLSDDWRRVVSNYSVMFLRQTGLGNAEGAIWAATWQKPTKWVCAQRRLGSVCPESSLWAQWVAKGPTFLHADSEDADQTGRMPRLIWVFAGRTLTLLVLSCRGSYDLTEATHPQVLLLNLNHGGPTQRQSIKPQPTCESFFEEAIKAEAQLQLSWN